jgi:hypothetical protein
MTTIKDFHNAARLNAIYNARKEFDEKIATRERNGKSQKQFDLIMDKCWKAASCGKSSIRVDRVLWFWQPIYPEVIQRLADNDVLLIINFDKQVFQWTPLSLPDEDFCIHGSFVESPEYLRAIGW